MSCVRIYPDIISSDLADEILPARWLGFAMLVSCDQKGQIRASVDGLARLANLSLKDTEAALDCLAIRKDEVDRIGDRLAVIRLDVNRWQLVNHINYRHMRNYVAQLEATRVRVRRYRERKRAEATADAS